VLSLMLSIPYPVLSLVFVHFDFHNPLIQNDQIFFHNFFERGRFQRGKASPSSVLVGHYNLFSLFLISLEGQLFVQSDSF
jgi:hypothetical protein